MPEEDEDAISDAIEENAIGPKRVQGDAGNNVEQHSIADQILADKYRRALVAQRNGIGIKYVKIIPPGTV